LVYARLTQDRHVQFVRVPPEGRSAAL
jgi:hypothetical protein